MNSLEHWFRNQLERDKSLVSLEDALLSGRFAQYFVYRLRLFSSRLLVTGLLHVIEFLILRFTLTHEVFVAALMFRLACGIIAGWWWGGLEIMRNEVRALRDDQATYRIPVALAPWMSASLVYGACTLILVFGWVILDASSVGWEFNVFHLYVFAVGFRLSVSFVVRAFHSGVYAIRRIYRPFVSTIAADVFAFVGTLVLWPLLREWALPTMLILSGLLVSSLTLVFTSRAYELTGLFPSRPRMDRATLTILQTTISRSFLRAGCANAFVQLEGALVFVLFPFTGSHAETDLVFLVMYCVSPFVRASREWAQLLYFDFKRLDLQALTCFKKRFEQSALWTSHLIAISVWLVSSILATLVLRVNLGLLYLLLLPFFLIRSQLAVHQIRAFVEQRFVVLVGSGFMIGAAALVMQGGDLSGNGRILVLTCVLVAATIWLQLTRPRSKDADNLSGVFSLPVWLSKLQQLNEPVRIRSVRFAGCVNDAVVENVAREILEQLGSDGSVTIAGRKRITWFELVASKQAPSNKWIISLGAGLLENMRTTEAFDCGQSVICAATAGNLRDCLTLRNSQESASFSAVELQQRFTQLFPHGMFHDVGAGTADSFHQLSSADRREVMNGALEHSKNPFKANWRNKYDVTTFCIDGEIRQIFCVDRRENKRSRATWRAFINSVNSCSAIKPVARRSKHASRTRRACVSLALLQPRRLP